MKKFNTLLTEGNVIAKERQDRLKAAIENNEVPEVYNASWTNTDEYTLGDLEALGWMKKYYTHDSSGEVDGWTRDYLKHAPGSFKLITHGGKARVINPGDEID